MHNTDKLLNDLHRLMASQNFETEEDVKAFMQNMIGQKIPEFPDEILSGPERAEDLVFKAKEATNLAQARKYIKQALELDPDSISAWDAAGGFESDDRVAFAKFHKAVELGRKKYDEAYIAENKGHFWLIPETRPFMRALAHYGKALCAMHRKSEGIEVFEEMIELCPNDNVGIRDVLLPRLLEAKEYEKYEKYVKMYEPGDSLASMMNHALYLFATKGVSAQADMQLRNAFADNAHVAKVMLSKKPQQLSAGSYTVGGLSEAEYYAGEAMYLWKVTPGALAWLERVARHTI